MFRRGTVNLMSAPEPTGSNHPYARFGLWILSGESFETYARDRASIEPLFQARRGIESELLEQLGDEEQGFLPGYCWVCQDIRGFLFDRKYAPPGTVNWRERLECPTCGLNNRLRLSVQVLDRQIGTAKPRIYITEQVTPLANYLRGRYPTLVASEFLGDSFSPGQTQNGIRHEDVTKLSMADDTFDLCLSFDVLEHVPDYRSALAQFFRVLRPGGKLILSVPFGAMTEKNVVRARVLPSGEVEHLLPPEYHGDPVDPSGGILCYYHFGWELLDDLRDAGFRDASLSTFWSLPFGHVGNEQLLLFATK